MMDSPEKKRRGRKRNRNPDKWKKNIRKRLINSGQEYINTSVERHKSSYNSLIQSMRQRQQRKNTVVEKQVEDADDLSILIHLADSDKDSDNIQTNSLTRRKRRRILDSDDDDDGVGESRVTVGQKTSSDLSVRSSLVDSKPTTKIIELSDEDMFDEDMFEEDMFDENTEVDTDFEEAMDSTKVKSQPNTNETSQSIDYIPLGQVMKEKRFQDCQDSDSESNKSISLLLLNHDVNKRQKLWFLDNKRLKTPALDYAATEAKDSLLDQHMKSQINGPVIVKPINIKEELGLFDNTLDENEFNKIVSVENELLVDQRSSVGTLHESLSVNPSVSTDSQLDDPDFEVELEEMLQDSMYTVRVYSKLPDPNTILVTTHRKKEHFNASKIHPSNKTFINKNMQKQYLLPRPRTL
uniref:Uncharacterized protein n=1 Tax=Timema tahoe TaxID=61484 RepID=A0A7R9INX3_9NEOP|nr:unnamed protein product [Timema tahoe]